MATYEMYTWSVTHRSSGVVVKHGKVDCPTRAKWNAKDVMWRGLPASEFFGEVRDEAGRLKWSSKKGGR